MSGVIDLTGDDDESPEVQQSTDTGLLCNEEDEDLKLAIALSLQDQADTDGSVEVSAEHINPPRSPIEPGTSSSAQGGLLGLDRKAMEAERLARLKRKREPKSEIQPNGRAPPQPSSISTRISPPPPRNQKPSSTQSIPVSSPQSTTKIDASSQFRVPQVLLTSEPSRRDRTNPTKYISISFADIIAPPSTSLQLKSTLLSSFIADFDWILPHFNTRTTTFLLVLHAQNAQHRTLLEGDFAGLPNVKLVIPEVMGEAGNMHSKVMLLFYQSSPSQAISSSSEEICRLVIPSANLTRADWGVGGVMENIVFVVDLPLKNAKDHIIYRFEQKLRAQLAAMDIPESALRKLEKFDFTATKNMEFVYSNSGSNLLDMSSTRQMTTSGTNNFFGPSRKVDQAGQQLDVTKNQSSSVDPEIDDPARTGLLSLNDAVVSLGMDVSIDSLNDLPQVDFVTSSLGNLTAEFVRQLYLAVCGQLDPGKIVAKPKRSSGKSADTDTALDQAILQNLRIYFPSSETVLRSKGGPGAGGTICFQRKWWDTNDLIRKCLHDCVGVRGDGILMHSKILYVRFTTPKVAHGLDAHDRSYLGWAYVGSANLSESAWGRVVSDAKSRQPKLTCRNWESGILLPVETNNPVQTGRPKHEAAARIQSQLGRESAIRAEDVSNKANLRADGYVAPTGVKKVVMQVELGEEDSASRSNSSGSGRSNASNKNKEAGARGAMQQDDVNGILELPSLVEVFSGVVPVPLRYPAPSHIARQQTPWFFME